MRRPVAAALLIAALAGPLRAEGGPSPEDEARLEAAIVEAGCVLTQENAETVLAAAKMRKDDAAIVIGRLIDAGKGEARDDGGFRLTSGACG